MMYHLELYDAVRSVPKEAQKPIIAGRLKGKTDINPMWRIKTLTEQFGPCGFGWYYKPVKQWLEPYEKEVAAFVQIELYIKVGGEWSQPISGIGGSMFAKKEGSGIHVSDECFKMATTDAISVACKQLGIGADIYWNADASKYAASTITEAETNQEESFFQKSSAKEKLVTNITEETRQRFAEVERELRRTGYTPNSVCKLYHLESIYDMTDLQIKNFLKKIQSVPNRQNAV